MKIQSNPLLSVILLLGMIVLSSYAKQPKLKRKLDIRGSKLFNHINENNSFFCDSDLLSSNLSNNPLDDNTDICPIVGSEITI